MAVTASQSFSDYDPLAWFYDLYWGPANAEALEPVLEEVLLERLPENARVLDLGCGTGQLDQRLAEHGFEVHGIDGSRAMLAYARNNAPSVELWRADLRSFEGKGPYDAVISMYETINHLLTEDELSTVFDQVAQALRPKGYFLFDVNLSEAYGNGWTGTDGFVEDDHVLFTRNSTDPEAATATSELTLFRYANGAWRRSDLLLRHRWYAEQTLLDLLAEAGFETAAIYDAVDDLGLAGETGRTFYLVQKGD